MFWMSDGVILLQGLSEEGLEDAQEPVQDIVKVTGRKQEPFVPQ